MRDYPRVLVLTGYGFNQTCGGSITLTNLFRGWPKDKLAIMFADHNDNDPEIVEKTLRLKRELFIPYLNVGVPWYTQKAIKKNIKKTNNNGKKLSQRVVFFIRTLLRKIFDGLGITGVLERYPLSSEVEAFFDSFNPEILYTHVGGIAFSNVALGLIEKYNIPTVVHIMDDYPNSRYRTGLFSFLVRKKMNTQLTVLFNKASVCMGICKAMCEEYEKRYGHKFVAFHNPVNPCFERDDENNAIPKTNGSIVAVYSGRVSWGVFESLKEICDAFTELKEKNGIDIEFKILTNDTESVISHHPFFLSLPSNIKLEEAPQDTVQIAAVLKNSNMLILPVEFDPVSIKAIRLSMPTKVPAYMASASPILVYGPKEVPFVADAADRGWAHVINSKANLVSSLKGFMEDKELQTQLVETATDISSKEFNYLTVQSRFIMEIKKALAPSNRAKEQQ